MTGKTWHMMGLNCQHKTGNTSSANPCQTALVFVRVLDSVTVDIYRCFYFLLIFFFILNKSITLYSTIAKAAIQHQCLHWPNWIPNQLLVSSGRLEDQVPLKKCIRYESHSHYRRRAKSAWRLSLVDNPFLCYGRLILIGVICER